MAEKKVNVKSIPEPVADVKENPSDLMVKSDAAKVRPAGGWILMTEEEVIQHQASGKLVGYDTETKQGLLKEGN